MDLPNYKKSLQLHEQKWACSCQNRIYVYRIHSNGTKHWGAQCLKCGKFSPLKRDDIPLSDRNCGQYNPEAKLDYEKRKGLDYQKTVLAVKQDEFSEKQTEREAYYQTEAWKKLTRLRMRLNEKLFGGLCERCFENKASRCHHLTYERLYEEWIFDLAAVCEDCHVAWHIKNPNWGGHKN